MNKKVTAENTSSEAAKVIPPGLDFSEFQNNYFSKLRNSEPEKKSKEQNKDAN